MSTHPIPFESWSMSTCSKSTMLQFYYTAKVGLTCLSFTMYHLMWNCGIPYHMMSSMPLLLSVYLTGMPYPMMPESDTFDLSRNPSCLIPASVQDSIGRMTEVSIECPKV